MTSHARCRLPRGVRSVAALILLIALTPAGRADVLDDVKARGTLRCGVNGEVPGLSYRGKDGTWSGLDVDFCRAVAAAALGSADKVDFVPLGTEERFAALRDGKVDLLSRNTTWTARRELGEGVSFAGVLYFDGQGFMVPRTTDTLSALELDGAKLCAVVDTTGPDNATRYFTQHRMRMTLSQYPDLQSARDAYLAGECDAVTTDHAQLYALRMALAEPDAHRILPEVISKEPLGPAVRKGETRWFDLVRWILYTLINAEELGIDSDNVIMAKSRAESPTVRTLLDLEGTSASALGVEHEWGYRALQQVGNYGELYERNLGSQSGLGIKRGLNELWSRGGLLYAPPVR